MDLKFYSLIITIMILVKGESLLAQKNINYSYPKVGNPIPSYTLDNITHYTSTKTSLKDFRGKWLILDFWNSYCATCIESFPKINNLQQQFKDKVQFIMVGANDYKWNKNIRKIFERFRQKQNLQLVAAYDSVLFKRWNISSVPHIIIIDEKGIVRAITGGRDMNAEKIEAFLNGKNPTLYSKDRTVLFDPLQLLLSNGNGGDDTVFLFRSVLAIHKDERQWAPQKISDDVANFKKGRFQVTSVPLYWLYNYAYMGQNRWSLFRDSLYGKVSLTPVLEISDPTPFDFDFGKKAIKGLYNYSLSVPISKATPQFMMEMMQGELKSYFGYDASIEIRKMPCWKLIATENAKQNLKTKGGAILHSEFLPTGISLKNVPINEILMEISTYHQTEPPFIDETDITTNIDISIDALLTDLHDIKEALIRIGLDLVKTEKEMKVIVIRDAKNVARK